MRLLYYKGGNIQDLKKNYKSGIFGISKFARQRKSLTIHDVVCTNNSIHSQIPDFYDYTNLRKLENQSISESSNTLEYLSYLSGSDCFEYSKIMFKNYNMNESEVDL